MIKIISFPRSGQELLEKVLRFFYKFKNIEYSYCHYYSNGIHNNCECFCEELNCKNLCLFQKNHDFYLNDYSKKNYKHICANIDSSKGKYIVLYRDDIVENLESIFRYEYKDKFNNFNYENLELQSFFKNEIKDGFINKNYFDNFKKKWVLNNNNNIFKIEYNNFLKNYEEILNDLLNNFLNLNISIDLLKDNLIRFNIKKKNNLTFKNYNILKNIILSKNLKLIINPQHGLGNRLRAIASAYSIAKETNRILVIKWIPDEHCDCKFNDLFKNNFMTNYEDKQDIKIYNYMELEENGIKNELINTNINSDIFVKSNCILNHKFSSKHYKQFFNKLEPVDFINKLIKKDTSDYIGIHIRMDGGKNYSSKSYENESNWTKEEAKKMFYYRNLSHIDNFINYINLELHNNINSKFYIATDRLENYVKLVKLYGTDKIYFLKRNNFDRSLHQLYYAVADLIQLSKCKKFYGSYWSSFSEIVVNFQKKNVQNLFSNKFKNNCNVISNYLNTNFFDKKVESGNTIITSCMNRNDNLLTSIESWLDVFGLNEIVVIDWGSTISVQDSLKEINDDRIKIYRVNNVEKWCLTKSFNLAIKCASFSNIYKLDCEDIVDKNLINNHLLNDNIFYCGNWKDATNNNDLQINGKLFCTYQNLIKINGYNENITTYGYDDDDICNRLNKDLNKKYIKISNFCFINHNDDSRLQNSNLKRSQSIQFNKRLNLLWNKNYLQSEFNKNFDLINSYNIDLKFVNIIKINTIQRLVEKYY